VVVDWERRGKRRRQAAADTQINADTPADLAAVRAATTARVLCRIDRWGPTASSQIDMAVARGADEVLLPMVRRVEVVDAALDAVAGRCGLGVLVETTDAVGQIDDLVLRPLSRVYVGLNDLMIDRGARSQFTALADGTVDRVARAVRDAELPFGVGGLTVPERGHPIPSLLVMGALARLGASFTFLRRSFYADTIGRDLAIEVPRMRAAMQAARLRDEAQVSADHAALAALVSLLNADAV